MNWPMSDVRRTPAPSGARRGPVAADAPRRPRVAVACQGGGAHTAFTAGVLRSLLADERFDYMGFSGTSGGAICATIAWHGVARGEPGQARQRLLDFWHANAVADPLEQVVNDLTVQMVRMSHRVPMPSLNPNQLPNVGQPKLQRLLEQHIPFDEFEALTHPGGPRLMIGAVDAVGGQFDLFQQFDSPFLKQRLSSVTPKAILASAAIPTIFPAVEIDGRFYWDGLFSQNPPVLDFLKDVPAAERPEQIWVIRINPQRIERVPTELGEIADRRNQLAGNLSLNQELETIESVRRVLIAAGVPTEKIPRTYVLSIQMPGIRDYATKLERSRHFIDELIAAGEEEGQRFLEGYESAIAAERSRVAELERTVRAF